MQRVPAHKGMLCHLIKHARPDLVSKIEENQVVETAVVGLGGQGTRHAGLMRDFGTTVTAGIAAGRGGQRVHETIPVYDSMADCLEEHPDIAAVSIWRHYSSARDSTLEVIKAGSPLVMLITEGIPLGDVRDILVAMRKHKTVLFGGNTPGVIFPPEGIKIGMLPDVFYPEEIKPGMAGPHGVTIISRSGAILYHMSDALASAGIAQNAVLGIGGDAANGSTFQDLVPMVMDYENTDLVVIAGEIGGSKEELLAEDIKAHPEKYPKPMVALITGAKAPEGKTMGHAGAIVAPGQEYGTYKSKKEALESAGVTVVNNQYDLISVTKDKLRGKTYFDVSHYYEKMKTTWDEPPKKPSWGTLITRVAPNSLLISGYPLEEIVEKKTFLETTHLLVKLEFPTENILKEHAKTAYKATQIPAPKIERFEGEDISAALAKAFLTDRELFEFPEGGKDGPVNKTIFSLGRFARYLANLLGNEESLQATKANEPFSISIYRAITGEMKVDKKQARMFEAMIVASVDHGVTPPSPQATIIAATVRSSFNMGIAAGVGAITDVHGGAGAKAAAFFRACIAKSKEKNIDPADATLAVLTEYMKKGQRIEGMGHRIHTQDPRRNVLWKLADELGIAGDCVGISKIVGDIFEKVRGISLPINVDGVIGAIVADMGLDVDLAKALFIFGRVAGLSAHFYEERAGQTQMRRVNFSDAVYKGKELRHV
ncbi:MAG: citrate/2-methylcitrate synthase [bacterium]